MGGLGRKPIKVPPSKPERPHKPPPNVIDEDKDSIEVKIYDENVLKLALQKFGSKDELSKHLTSYLNKTFGGLSAKIAKLQKEHEKQLHGLMNEI